MNEPNKLLEKFVSLIDKSSDCWEWKGSKPKKGDGYGWFSLGYKSDRAHRVAYRFFIGEIPSGMLVCHKCDNRGCVNPEHLFLGTAADNNKDRHSKGRSVIPCGEKHGGSKITRIIASKIIQEYESGVYYQREIGLRYGISQAAVSKIILGELWKNL